MWHLFVLAGSTSHYFAILFYVAGRAMGFHRIFKNAVHFLKTNAEHIHDTGHTINVGYEGDVYQIRENIGFKFGIKKAIM